LGQKIVVFSLFWSGIRTKNGQMQLRKVMWRDHFTDRGALTSSSGFSLASKRKIYLSEKRKVIGQTTVCNMWVRIRLGAMGMKKWLSAGSLAVSTFRYLC
jgi:hypothetical protein